MSRPRVKKKPARLPWAGLDFGSDMVWIDRRQVGRRQNEPEVWLTRAEGRRLWKDLGLIFEGDKP